VTSKNSEKIYEYGKEGEYEKKTTKSYQDGDGTLEPYSWEVELAMKNKLGQIVERKLSNYHKNKIYNSEVWTYKYNREKLVEVTFVSELNKIQASSLFFVFTFFSVFVDLFRIF